MTFILRPPGYIPPQSFIFENYEAYELGTQPNDWAIQYPTTDQKFQIVEDIDLPGGRGLQIYDPPNFTQYYGFHFMRSPITIDCEVLSVIKLPDPLPNHPGNFRPVGLSVQEEYDGYFVMYNLGPPTTVRIRKIHSDGTLQDIAQVEYPVSAGDIIWSRLRREGSIITLRSWADDDDEPTDWLLAVDDPVALGPGRLGAVIGGNSTSGSVQTHIHGAFSAAYGGGRAPYF